MLPPSDDVSIERVCSPSKLLKKWTNDIPTDCMPVRSNGGVTTRATPLNIGVQSSFNSLKSPPARLLWEMCQFEVPSPIFCQPVGNITLLKFSSNNIDLPCADNDNVISTAMMVMKVFFISNF